ncbi:hypothetical protein HGH93_30590 [Chitinophaga polysaccharea]|uniref:hypothetical protein n=1 Tax=Chitinophaga TaxID=79328 RepID=UPI001454FB7B|nr:MULTISPECIES: hypothetical protein [Chitinophaga]NLR62480.1 hypothetical protein [Chitinophaga polysaccharea]NLU92350.1 hypothetical protein [Chitinophaga sp. Ak27]
MKENKKLNLERFESLSEDAEGKLVSGFSEAFDGEDLAQIGANNCYGGNCAAGCSQKPPTQAQKSL